MRFFIKTLGCRTNIAESEWLMENLIIHGWTYDSEEFDVAIVNSCTVTANADRKTQYSVRQLKRKNPKSKVFLTGCFARRRDKTAQPLKDIEATVATVEETARYLLETYDTPAGHQIAFVPPDIFRSRATIKVQEGCNSFCAYCIIPHVRGRERSISPEEVLAQCKLKFGQGYKELVLTGTHLGNYGNDLPSGITIDNLVNGILSLSNDFRVRLSSIEPEMYSESLYAVFARERVCPHVHLCLQSGSDTILHSMGRTYTTKEYGEIVTKLREVKQDIAITTDVIVGFPGETTECFQETVAYIKSMNFAKLHVFPFSKRPGTRAAYMGEEVDAYTIKERSKLLQEMSSIGGIAYAESFIGKTTEVIFENKCNGLTDNYLEVITDGKHKGSTRSLREVRIENVLGPLKVKGTAIIDK